MGAKDCGNCSKQMHVSLLPDKENASLTSLTHQFLFSRNDINDSNLFSHNIPEEKENKYLHKGMLFLSLLVQILLKHLANPLKRFGSTLEDFLNRNNTPSKRNRGASTDREDGDYFSLIGHMDTRTELDKEIKHGDGRYYPTLSIMAAKLSYENKNVIKKVVSSIWKMKFVGFYNFYDEFLQKNTTEAFIMHDQNPKSNMIIVSFRGTSPFSANDWSTDLDFSWLKIDGMGKIHKGFMMALGLQKCLHEDDEDDYFGHWPKNVEHDPLRPLAYYTIREKLKELLANNKGAKFIVTGHSLGGALAILFPAILALHGEVEILDRLEAIYTYGQPRVGNEKFGDFMKKALREHKIKYYRVVYGYDMVPTVPFDNSIMMFKHFGTCIHFNSLYQGKVVEEEQRRPIRRENRAAYPVKYVIALLWGLVMVLVTRILSTLCAVWQLIRGLIMEYAAGPSYKEGRVLIVARVLGILLAGTIEHFPQDYVNATRLAPEKLFKNYRAMAS